MINSMPLTSAAQAKNGNAEGEEGQKPAYDIYRAEGSPETNIPSNPDTTPWKPPFVYGLRDDD